MNISNVAFTTWDQSVTQALNAINACEILAKQSNILLKPNLVNSSPHPVTTSPDCCEAVIAYIQKCSKAEIVIGEGCGDNALETDQVFASLGYNDLAQQYSVALIDLNHAPLKRLNNANCRIFPEIYLPEIAFTHYIVSLPVLKAHSLSDFTGGLKNMIGFAPPEYYRGRFGSWKKAQFHNNLHEAIIELNSCRKADMVLMDASVGLSDFHLGGPVCNPPVNRIIAGYDPLEVDRLSAGLLNLDWRNIHHLAESG